MSGLPLKRFFNTSGLQYKALGLKDKLPQMSEDEQFALLATDGMLVKRPLLIGEDFALPGFKQAEWEDKLKKDLTKRARYSIILLAYRARYGAVSKRS